MTTLVKKNSKNNTTKQELINSLIKKNTDNPILPGGVCTACVGGF